MDPQISVVMPCHNAGQFIKDTISNVLRQSFQDFELVIVNDGSSDNSAAVIAEMASLDSRVILVTQDNQGAAVARNVGLAHASGEMIAFLDSDDKWDTDCLDMLRNALMKSGKDLVYCGWQNIGMPGGDGQPFVPPDYSQVDLVEAFLGGCRWPIHAVLTYKKTIDSVGNFDESLTSCMDYDLWLRLAKHIDVQLVPKVLAYYVHHGGEQITKNKTRLAFNHFKVQQLYLHNNPEIIKRLGSKRVRELTLGELMRRGFDCYWKRDLKAARSIFRQVMKRGYGELSDWKYMLPSLLPFEAQTFLIAFLSKAKNQN